MFDKTAEIQSATEALAAGLPEEALKICQTLAGESAPVPEVLLVQGEALIGLGRPKDALACLTTAVKAQPRSAKTHFLIGQAFVALDMDSEASKGFTNALRIDPDLTDAKIELATLLIAHGTFKEAIPLLESGIAVSEAAILRLTLAQALIGAGRSDEAEPHLVAGAREPATAGIASGMLGYWYQARGRFAESNLCFENSIKREPKQGLAYYGWMQSNRIASPVEPVVLAAREAVADNALSPPDRTALQYSLGKANDDLGRYEEAMSWFDSANAGAYEQNLDGRPFNRARYASIVDGMMAGLDTKALQRYSGIGRMGNLPVFVVGMMRSGTTLAEQILSSHPSVAGAGELDFWLEHWRAAYDSEKRVLHSTELAQLVERYVSLLRTAANGCGLVVDKMPQNFQLAGLLHVAFPNAPIIHMRRHPVDTCLSIYTTAYEQSPDFAHDRSSIAFAYRQYLRLTDHWRQTIPSDRYLEIDYEELVSKTEAMSRKMVEFCGLPWDDACLRPEANQRVVATPSLWQVRQPVYTTSTERWQKYRPWLREFEELL